MVSKPSVYGKNEWAYAVGKP